MKQVAQAFLGCLLTLCAWQSAYGDRFGIDEAESTPGSMPAALWLVPFAGAIAGAAYAAQKDLDIKTAAVVGAVAALVAAPVLFCIYVLAASLMRA